jgi:hypothetical protein
MAFNTPLKLNRGLLRKCRSVAVSGLSGWLVYDFVGLAVLRQTWINVEK